ncbi:MAG: alanine racemase [Clostridia bacterium]|nr:alanine racemase [Clostridia bacterium]
MLDHPRARCWLEVDLGAVKNNLQLTQTYLKKDTNLIAVLKADAYGMGAPAVGRCLWENGVRMFAVASLDEAFILREALPDAWILCMGETLDGNIEGAVLQGIRLTAGSLPAALRISEATQETGRQAYVHFKVDTGLHRIGFEPHEAVDKIEQCAYMSGIVAEGLYTHLALHDRESDIAQHGAFESVRSGLKEKGINVKFAHMLDSIGLVRYPEWQYDAVRVGALLYGNYPQRFENPERVRPVARFMARVMRVFDVKKGEYLGYDDDHKMERDSRIAAVSCGYVDGYPRVMSFKGVVLVRGKRAPVNSLLCMDQMMVDVTDIEGVRAGDAVTLLGDDITLREYAGIGALNRNEATAVIGKRVPRVYV